MMEMHASTSCVRFMESMQHKVEMMMRTGDVTDGRTIRRTPEEIDDLCNYASRLIDKGETLEAAAREIGVQAIVLRRRLEKR